MGLAVSRSALLFLIAFGCAGGEGNPPLEGFDLAGRRNWDNTRYLTWRFFGSRRHVWDKWTGDIRIESAEYLVLMNVHSQEGRA